jgi:hypothetical protein
MTYLLVPNVIFALGWLKPLWAFPIVIVAALCLLDVGRRGVTDTPALSWRTWAFVLAFAVFWAYAAGFGGLNAQMEDYLKHNLIFFDLITKGWPVLYHSGGPHDTMLCYYVAYYLPIGLLGKLFGLQYAAAFSLAWGLLGLALAFAWVCRLGRPYGPIVLALFTLVDNFCWLPNLDRSRSLHRLAILVGLGSSHDVLRAPFVWDLGSPPIRMTFHSTPLLIMWAPQHALGAWLATACVAGSMLEQRPARHVVLVNAAVLLWSPFVAVGLLPFTVAACLRDPRHGLSWPNLLGGAALGAPSALYFLAHDPQQFAGVLFSHFSGPADWAKYSLFLVLAVGILWAATWLVRRRYRLPDSAQWALFCLAALTLVATTFVYTGRFNDWVMRVSEPALFVFRIVVACTAVAFWRSDAPRRHRLAFGLLLLLSAEQSVQAYLLAPIGKFKHQDATTTIVTACRYAPSVARMPGAPGWDFASQYLGSTDSVFGRWLMKSDSTP